MRVFVGMERSGRVRQAFRRRGHDAWSCDLKPALDGSPFHIVGDVFDVLRDFRAALTILHPECRFLANSGVLRLYRGGRKENGIDPERWEQMELAAFQFRALLTLRGRVAIENPVMHGHALAIIGTPPSQSIQPYEFGEDASKRTCLWLTGLPRLTPTGYFPPRLVDGRPRWGNQTRSGQNRLSPSPERPMLRATTYPGIAEAFAEQWGHVVRRVDRGQLDLFGVAA